jgi:hypothetical protein
MGVVGAAWVFTRSGGVWTQQGPKLTGTGGLGFPGLGASVALSADGSTAIVGGPRDAAHFVLPLITFGGAWVFTRSGGVWTQQGPRLLGGGAVGGAQQGSSVSLSADGNTAIVGGAADNGSIGAAWVFTRSGGVWTQQGPKLVGSDASVAAQLGRSVALSADGNLAIVGGDGDDGSLEQRLCSPAAAACGRSEKPSWLAAALLGTPGKAVPSRCPPTATPPSSAGLATTGTSGRRGCSSSSPLRRARWRRSSATSMAMAEATSCSAARATDCSRST